MTGSKLQIGIVGLPNVGKSTLFNALTKKSVPAENYPFCTIDPAVGVVAVPDERVWKLAEFSDSVKTVPAAVEFVDIAGLVKGAAEGQGLGNQFLSHIRETDAIVEVVRIFEDGNVLHVDGGVNPKRDVETINLELVLADLQVVEKRIAGIARDVKRGDKQALLQDAGLQKLHMALAAGLLASGVALDEKERETLRDLQLLTAKPIFYALNKKMGGRNLDEMNAPRFLEVLDYIRELGAVFVLVDAKAEEDLKDFSEEEKAMLSAECGTGEDGVNELIQAGYRALGLISFFTTGEDETRAWTIPAGSSARDAGAAIHTDFRDKFIRAEVIFWEELLKAGSYAAARERGLIRTEGKEYIVKDGDVVEFKI